MKQTLKVQQEQLPTLQVVGSHVLQDSTEKIGQRVVFSGVANHVRVGQAFLRVQLRGVSLVGNFGHRMHLETLIPHRLVRHLGALPDPWILEASGKLGVLGGEVVLIADSMHTLSQKDWRVEVDPDGQNSLWDAVNELHGIRGLGEKISVDDVNVRMLQKLTGFFVDPDHIWKLGTITEQGSVHVGVRCWSKLDLPLQVEA